MLCKKGLFTVSIQRPESVDITNAVQSFDVLDGAIAVSQAYSYFPRTLYMWSWWIPGGGTPQADYRNGRTILFVAPIMACCHWSMSGRTSQRSATSPQSIISIIRSATPSMAAIFCAGGGLPEAKAWIREVGEEIKILCAFCRSSPRPPVKCVKWHGC